MTEILSTEAVKAFCSSTYDQNKDVCEAFLESMGLEHDYVARNSIKRVRHFLNEDKDLGPVISSAWTLLVSLKGKQDASV